MIEVLLAEQNQVLRLGIRSALGSYLNITIVEEISSKIKLLSSLQDLRFDVALVELTFFRSIEKEDLTDLRKRKPNLRLLVHSYGSDVSSGVEVIKRGVLGYLTKHCSPAELRRAIETVYSGKPYISMLMCDALAEHIFMPSRISKISLSAREFQVFKMLAIGIGITGIAAQLNLSAKTVSTYKMRLLQKIGLSSLSELVQHAISHELLSPQPDDECDDNFSYDGGDRG